MKREGREDEGSGRGMSDKAPNVERRVRMSKYGVHSACSLTIPYSALRTIHYPLCSPDAAHWLIVLWLCLVGGAVGSFLNVVVYRLPLGISLIRPPSHCPACKQPIRWFDNVPVFGWIMLRGRCRNCRSSISDPLSAGRGRDGRDVRRAGLGRESFVGRVCVSLGVAVYVAVRRVDEIRRESAAAEAIHSGAGRGHWFGFFDSGQALVL